MKLIPFNEALHQKPWDEFVMAQGSFFHLSAWHNVIKAAYPFQSQYCLWEQDGCIAGIFPGFLVKRPFAGKALISNPFAVSAGPLSIDPADQTRFVDAISQQAVSLDVDYIELRDMGLAPNSGPTGWTVQQNFSSFEKQLGPDHEQNFAEIPSRQRAVIRKAEALHLSLDHHQDLRRFLSIYAISLRNLGTPIYPTRYFEALLNYFPEQTFLSSVSHLHQDLSSVLCFHFKGKLMPYYGGGTLAAREFHSYPWMYWQLMKYGVDRGTPVFDFGRSPNDSGAFHFKKNLGFSPQPMQYHYLSVNGEVPDLTPNSGLVQKLTRIWRHLPIPLTKVVGPFGAVYAV